MNRPARTLAWLWLAATACGIPPAAADETAPRPPETRRLFEDAVTLADTFGNDAFVLANDVSLTGRFEDDLWAAGRTVRFNGEALDDLRLAGMDILTLDGPVGGDLIALAGTGNMLLDTRTSVQGDTQLRGNRQVTLRGRYRGDVRITAQRAVIDADIDGTLRLDAADIRVRSGTRIGGDLIRRGGDPVSLPEGVRLEGSQQSEPRTPSRLDATLQQWKWFLRVAQVLNAFLLGIVLIRFVPRFMGTSMDLLLQYRGPTLLTGLLFLLFGGLGGYLLLSTLLAGGLGGFLLLGTGMLFYAGKIPVALALGVYLLRGGGEFTFKRLALALLLGLLPLYLLFSVAFIGPPLYILLSCWGLGALVAAIRNSQRVIRTEIPPSLHQPDPPDKDTP